MFPTHSSHTTLDALLPKDPETGDVYTMPEGHIAGASHVLHVYRNGILVGGSDHLAKIINVPQKNYLARTWSNRKIKKGDVLEVQFIRYTIKSVVFIEAFGWIGHEYYPETEVLESNTYKVLAVSPVGPENENYHTYERVCLERISLKEPKNDPSTT